MGRLYTATPEALKAAQDRGTDAFNELMDQYNDRLADQYEAPEPVAPVATTPAPARATPVAAAPAAAPAAPTMHDPLLGGGVTAAALKSDPAYRDLSYRTKQEEAEKSMAQARTAMQASKTPDAAISTTLSNMRKEYAAALGPAPQSDFSHAVLEPLQAVGQGAFEAAKSVTDLFGADTGVRGNDVSAFLQRRIDAVKHSRSEKTLDDEKYISEQRAKLGPNAKMSEHVALAAKQFAQHPLTETGHLIGGIAPIMAAAPLGLAGIGAVSGAMGAGAVKSGIYEGIKNAPEEQLLSDPQYAALRSQWSEDTSRELFAAQQQSYSANGFPIALGGVVGAAGAVMSPVGRSLAGGFTAKGFAPTALLAAKKASAEKLLKHGVIRTATVGAVEQAGINAAQAAATAGLVTAGANKGGATLPDTAMEAAASGIPTGLIAGAGFAAHGRGATRLQAKSVVDFHNAREAKIAEAAKTAKGVEDGTIPLTPENSFAQDGPHAWDYIRMGVPEELVTGETLRVKVNGKKQEVRLGDIDPATFKSIWGESISEAYPGATDEIPPRSTPPPADSTAPGSTSAFEKIYAEHGVDMTLPREDLMVDVPIQGKPGEPIKFEPKYIGDIDPATIQTLMSRPLSELFTDARDLDAGALKEVVTKTATPTSEAIDTTPPYADVPGPVIDPVAAAAKQAAPVGVHPPILNEPLTNAIWHSPDGVDHPVTLSGHAFQDRIGTLKPDGTQGAFIPRNEVSAAPEQTTQTTAPRRTEFNNDWAKPTRPLTDAERALTDTFRGDVGNSRQRETQGELDARGGKFVDDNGQPIGAQQAAENIVAKLEASLGIAESPVVEPPVAAPPVVKPTKLSKAKPAKPAKLAPAGKKKVSDSQETTHVDTRTGTDTQRREGQVAPVESAGNTETVAGQKAGAAERVGVDLQQLAGAGGKTETSGGRAGAGTAGAEPSAVAGGKLTGARLGKPDGRRRVGPNHDKTATKEQATEHWNDMVDPNLEVSYDDLGPRAQQVWTGLVSRFLAGVEPKNNRDFSTTTADGLAMDVRTSRLGKAAATKTAAESTALKGDESTRSKRVDARDRVGETDSTLERAKTANGEIDHPEVWAAAKTGNAEAVLEAIANTELTREQRQIVDRLRGTLGDVVVVPLTERTPGYDHTHKTARLNNGSVESALHELAHAGTVHAINEVQRGRGTPEQVTAVRELANLQKIIETEGKLADVSAFDPKSYEGKPAEAMDSIRAAEIVAEVPANPIAARALARIGVDGQGFTGVKRFVAAVRDLLGLKPSADSALAKVLRLTDPLLAKTEAGSNALVNSGFELGTLNRVSTRAKAPDEPWFDYAKRRGLVFGESAWVADSLKKRPNESWGDYVARKTTVFYKPVTAAERGHTVYSNDGKFLGGFTTAAEAKALQAQHPGSRIDTQASIFSVEKSIGAFMETMRNKTDARVTADGDTYVKPLETKLGAYYKEVGGSISDAHADLNTAANALSVIGANEVGRRVHTKLTEIAEAKRRALDHQVKTGTIAPSTAWRAMKVLADNPANRALDAAGNPGAVRENFGGYSTAEAQKILAAHPAAEKFLTTTAKPELDAIRTRLRELDVEGLQYDARAGGIIDMYSDKHHFPLFGKEGGPLVDVPRGMSSTESGTLHVREGREGAAHVPLDTLVDTLTTANQRIVERDRNTLLNKMFFAAHNPNSPDHANAKLWFEQAGIKYVKGDVLDATDQARHANQATQGSSKTIITRRLIAGGKGKIQQLHFTVDDSMDNGQRGANFIAAWSGAHIAEPGIVLRGMTAVQRGFTATLTRLNPLFAPYDWYRTQKMVGSLAAGDFGVGVGGKFLSKMAETNPGAIAKALTGAADASPTIVRVIAEMREMGALTTYSGSYGLKNTAVRLQGSQRLGSLRDKATHSIDIYNEAFEWSPRVAAYMTLREHGLSPTDAGLWSLKVANFSAGGEWTPIIRAFVPFYNPGIQGIRRMADVVQQVKTGNTRMVGVLAVRALTAAVLYAMNNTFVGKDDEGKDIYAKMSGSKHYRNNYIPNPLGDGLIALPRPIDMGPVDGIGVAIARLMLGHTTIDQALGEYAQDGAQRLSPVEVKDYHSLGANILAAMSGVLRPLVEVGMNETGLGTPISRDHKREHKLAAFNGRENTPQVYKDVAATLGTYMSSVGGENVSPEDVRHLFKSYGGWFTSVLDNFANKADDKQAPVSAAKLTPLVGRFLEDKPTSDARYYDLNKSAQYTHDKLNSMSAEARDTARTADPKAAATADLWAESYKADMALAKEAKAMNRTPADKKAEVLEKRNRIHDDFIRRYREINK